MNIINNLHFKPLFVMIIIIMIGWTSYFYLFLAKLHLNQKIL